MRQPSTPAQRIARLRPEIGEHLDAVEVPFYLVRDVAYGFTQKPRSWPCYGAGENSARTRSGDSVNVTKTPFVAPSAECVPRTPSGPPAVECCATDTVTACTSMDARPSESNSGTS
jgi:hypothetical protein